MKPPTLDPRLHERLREAERRFEELDTELISPEVLKSPQRLRELGQERSRLEEIVGIGSNDELIDRIFNQFCIGK